MQRLAVKEGALLASKEVVARRDLPRLSQPFHGSPDSQALALFAFCSDARCNEWRQNGTRGHDIDTDALLHQLIQHGARECYHGPLARRIIDAAGHANIRVDRGTVNDDAARG